MNSDNIERFSELSDLILSAALDPVYWQDFLDRVGQFSGGIRTHMFGHDCGGNEFLGMTSSGYSRQALREYEDYFHKKNMWAETFVKHSTGTVLHSEEMCSLERMESSEFYNDWVRPQEDIVGGGGSVLFNEDGRVFLFGGNIRRRDIEKKEKEWMNLVGLLTPQIQKALNVNQKLAYLNFEHQLLQGKQTQSTAIFIVNAREEIKHTNRDAEEMLNDGNVVKSDTLGRLVVVDATMRSVFDHSISSLRTVRLNELRDAEITTLDGEHQFNMKVVGIPDPVRLNRLSGLVPTTGSEALILFLTPVSNGIGLEHKLKRDFSLTDREAQVVSGFSNGKDIKGIARESSVSEHTIRNQLKSSMSKMGVHRQVDLVRMVLRRSW